MLDKIKSMFSRKQELDIYGYPIPKKTKPPRRPAPVHVPTPDAQEDLQEHHDAGTMISRVEAKIPDATAALVCVIAVCAFALSFYNLQQSAVESGIFPLLAWMWPLCVDCLLIAGSLMILRSSLRGEPALVGWAVLLAFTVISIVFNAIHSPPALVDRVSHAIPPLSLCVSIELLMIIIRSDLRRPVPITTQAEVPACAPEPAPGPAPVTGDRATKINRYFKKNPGNSLAQAAKDLGMARRTITRYREVTN
jgi:hypothetical protein